MSQPAQLQPYLRHVLSLLTAVTPQRDGWTCRCPVPSHGNGSGDNNPSLRVTVGDAGRILLLCRGGCSTDDVLAAIRLDWTDLFPGPGEQPQPPLCLGPVEGEREDAMAGRAEVYAELLRLLPLNEQHKRHLRRRGLTDAACGRLGYGGLTDRRLTDRTLEALQKKYSTGALLATPGIAPCPRRGLKLTVEHAGVLVPCRTLGGAIRAVKVRCLGPDVDAGKHPRYLYLSGGEASSSCGAWAHAPLGTPERLTSVILTEGEIKADVVYALTGRYAVSCPGVGLAMRALPLIESLPGRPDRVDVAFDWPDVISKPNVRHALAHAVQGLGGAGLQVGLLTWDKGHGKGIDDVLAAKKAYVTVEPGGVAEALADARRQCEVSRPREAYPATLERWDRPAFPVDVFPKALADYARTAAAAKQCPPDFIALSMLVVAGAAIGTTRQLELMPGWSTFPAFYGVIVAPPGQRKTPAMKAVLRPVYRRQRDEVDRAKLVGGREEITHFYIQDATVEAVTQILDRQPRGSLLVRDEVLGWVNAENQYRQGRGSDREFWLQVWSNEPAKNDRKVSGTLMVNEPFLGVLGGVQPDRLGGLKAPGGDDGFTDRLLFTFPSPCPPARWGVPGLGDGQCRPWDDAVAALYALERTPDDDCPETTYPATLRLSPAAEREWAAWYDAHGVRDAQMPPPLRGAWSKMTMYCPRVALTLALLERAAAGQAADDSPLEACHVKAAIECVEYFTQHAWGVVLAQRHRPNDPTASRVVDLASASPGGVLTCRDAMRRLRLPTRSEAMALFRRAEDLGKGEVVRHVHAQSRRPVDAFKAYADPHQGGEE